MSQTQEKKSRFAVSQEVQTEFVEAVAGVMSELADKFKMGDRPTPAPQPFCPVTGYAYAGANMARLMLESMKQGYSDDRWLTFKQLQHHRFENKDFTPKIRKGEHGVKLLRSEDVYFTVDPKGKWNFLTEEQAKEARKIPGGPRVQHKTLMYPYTVFNCSQIEGFPPKENPAPALSEKERNELLDKFVACSGIPVEHGGEKAVYEPEEGLIKLPSPEQFGDMDSYQAMKLRLAFHATGHVDREDRAFGEEGRAETLRGETFSMLAGARYGLPMPVDGGSWEAPFKENEIWEALGAAADAARMLSVLDQFARDEQPKARWFPKQEEWPSLIAANEQMQAITEQMAVTQAVPEQAAPRPRVG